MYNVAETAPYMHDGSVASLRDAVDREIYYRSSVDGRPISLTSGEKDDLIAFLKALSSQPAADSIGEKRLDRIR